MPPSSVTDEELGILQSAMEQLIDHKGITPECPLKGLGIPGFYLLMETMHFKPLQQKIYHRTADLIVDEMTMAHVMSGQQITLYNAVEPIRELAAYINGNKRNTDE